MTTGQWVALGFLLFMLVVFIPAMVVHHRWLMRKIEAMGRR